MLLKIKWLNEPFLSFAAGALHVDVKTGLARYGPASLGSTRHPSELRLGFVGTGQSIASAQDWFGRASKGVLGDPARKLPDFPGFTADRGFFTRLLTPDHLVETITTNEISSLRQIKSVASRFQRIVELVAERVCLLSTKDDGPSVIVLALPDQFLEMTKRVRVRDSVRGQVGKDLRRALKAELMRFRVPTQIILQRVSEAAQNDPNVDHPSRVAWNLLTSVFFKAGGIPWKPVGLRSDTCYIGISFHRPFGADNTVRCSVAQAFDEHGTGLVLRGPEFRWDTQRDGPSPHLTGDQAQALIDTSLKRYVAEVKRSPKRVVIHKTSRYWSDEREGFQHALSSYHTFDLMALAPTSEMRLLRTGDYPPLRGTLFSVRDLSFLYTTGYISALNAYPHGHVPAPLQIADHYGDSPVESIATEILTLSKMNWNSAGFAGALPITLRFSKQVGDIMREIPQDRDPLPQYKFYT